MAATYASSDLLGLWNDYAGRPATGDSLSDANKYARLARAQNVVIEDLAARVPQPQFSHAAYGSTPTLTTTDNQVFIFGASDLNTDPMFPIGKVNIYPSLASIPDSPLIEGVDYLWEGTQIRIPNNGTYTGTLYWRGVAPVLALSATNQPTLSPPPARILIVLEAVRAYAVEGMQNPELAQQMAQEYGVGFSRWCLTLKTAQQNRGQTNGPLTGMRLAQAGY
jgi:hypothetical protein